MHRADFHLSSNSLAKPMILFSIAFIIITISSGVQMALQVKNGFKKKFLEGILKALNMQGESLPESMWKSWTYVADPGFDSLLCLET